jgi:HmuY protein
MRVTLGSITLSGVLWLLGGCSSTPVNDEGTAGGGNGATGGSENNSMPSACSGALRQSLGLVAKVSTAAVSIITDGAAERTLYVDASAGGINGQDAFPWVYLSLATGQRVALTDIDALSSKAWDLAFKRFVVRTNSGDSGPGNGGAIRIALSWDKVDASTLGKQMLPRESWFDADCNLNVDENMELITTFTGWSEYDQVDHVLSPADVVYITAGADGSLYKVGILDYYSTPTGAHGTVAGRYKVRVAPLP